MFSTAISSSSYILGMLGFLGSLPLALFQIFIRKILNWKISTIMFLCGTLLLIGDIHYFYKLSIGCNLPNLLIMDLPEENISKPQSLSHPNGNFYQSEERLKCESISHYTLPSLKEFKMDRIKIFLRLSLFFIVLLIIILKRLKFRPTKDWNLQLIKYTLFLYGFISCLLTFIRS
jgi:hypothetical protein